MVVNKKIIFIKKKKRNFLFFEDLNKTFFKISNSRVILNSMHGFNFLNLVLPNIRFLALNLYYAPIHNKFVISLNILVRQLKLFLKGICQGFFLEYRIIGLGFKIKKTADFSLRSVKFDIGFSHFIKLPISKMLRLCRIKKRFLFFSTDYSTIKLILKQIQNIRKHNPYKLRGLKLTGASYRIKPGKKQTKR